jgi:hypothetical protein
MDTCIGNAEPDRQIAWPSAPPGEGPTRRPPGAQQVPVLRGLRTFLDIGVACWRPVSPCGGVALGG